MTVEIPRPSVFARWADQEVVDPVTNAPNVVEPTESHKNVGWMAFEPPARNYFNWIHNTSYKWDLYFDYLLNTMEKITDGTGVELFSVQNCIIQLYAVDTTTPANYIFAIGFKGTTSHDLNVIDNNVLTLGSQSADGTQAISGGTAGNILVLGKSRKPEA